VANGRLNCKVRLIDKKLGSILVFGCNALKVHANQLLCARIYYTAGATFLTLSLTYTTSAVLGVQVLCLRLFIDTHFRNLEGRYA
jgi:hypothetical protein